MCHARRMYVVSRSFEIAPHGGGGGIQQFGHHRGQPRRNDFGDFGVITRPGRYAGHNRSYITAGLPRRGERLALGKEMGAAIDQHIYAMTVYRWRVNRKIQVWEQACGMVPNLDMHRPHPSRHIKTDDQPRMARREYAGFGQRETKPGAVVLPDRPGNQKMLCGSWNCLQPM